MKIQVYTTFDEKYKAYYGANNVKTPQQFWQIDTIEQWREFVNYMHQEADSYIFRGVNEAKYKIYTSLQRAYLDGKVSNKLLSPNQLIQLEIDNLKQSSGNILPKYHKQLNIIDSDFTYLSFLQHHRAPSPFLDFSHSFDNALFFAIDGVKYDTHNPDNELNDYISIIWINTKGKTELIPIAEAYANMYSDILDVIESALKISNKLNIELLEIENVLKWSNPNNQGEGLCKISLGLVDEVKSKNNYVYRSSQMNRYLSEFVKLTPQGQYTADMLFKLKKRYHDFILQNIKLTNLNVVAQDGCFLLYNPQGNAALEEYWHKNPTYIHLPQLNCANIHKSLVNHIDAYLKQHGITSATIYPNTDQLAQCAFLKSTIF